MADYKCDTCGSFEELRNFIPDCCSLCGSGLTAAEPDDNEVIPDNEGCVGEHKPISEAAVPIIHLIKTGFGDMAVFFNGVSILVADPSAGDDTMLVQTVCDNLLEASGGTLFEKTWNPSRDCWTWDDIIL